jgi:hypothetical protein
MIEIPDGASVFVSEPRLERASLMHRPFTVAGTLYEPGHWRTVDMDGNQAVVENQAFRWSRAYIPDVPGSYLAADPAFVWRQDGKLVVYSVTSQQSIALTPKAHEAFLARFKPASTIPLTDVGNVAFRGRHLLINGQEHALPQVQYDLLQHLVRGLNRIAIHRRELEVVARYHPGSVEKAVQALVSSWRREGRTWRW